MNQLFEWQQGNKYEPEGPPPYAWFWFQQLSNKLQSPKVFSCPADNRQLLLTWSHKENNLRDNNISYTIGIDAKVSEGKTVLLADRNLETPVSTECQRFISSGFLFPRIYRTLGQQKRLKWNSDQLHGDIGHLLLVDGTTMRTDHKKLNFAFISGDPVSVCNNLLSPGLMGSGTDGLDAR